MAPSSSLPNYLSFENQRTRCLDIGFNPDEGLLQDPQKHRSNDVKQGKEYSLRVRGGLQGLPAWWGKIHPPIGAKIRAAGIGFFLDAMSHYLTEHKDLILMCAMSERFWDTTNTFHLPKIGEMTLTPEDFTMISGLSFGGHWLVMDHEIEGKKKQLKESLGTTPQYVRGTSVKLTWLKSTFEDKKPEDKTLFTHSNPKGQHYILPSYLLSWPSQ